MYFNPPQNDKTSPFFHPLNKVNEEVKTIDKKKAKDIYDKLKKGSEIEVNFGNAFTKGGTPITLKVTSGHRVVGASRVGRIILVNKENPRGMKYKLFDRNGSVSLAQGDMGTILRDMKIVKEGVEELDEEKKKPISTRLGDAFDSGELEDRIKSMSGPARKSFTNLANSLVDFYHSMSDIHQVDGRQLEDKIDASPPRVRKMFAKLLDEDVQLDESRDDFDYLDIEAAMQDAKLEAPKVVKTRRGYQVMVFSRKLKKHIPQGPPHRSKAAAEKDAKMFEDVDLNEGSAKDKRMMKSVKDKLTKAGIKNAVMFGEVHVAPNNVKEAEKIVGSMPFKVVPQKKLKDDVQIDEASKMGLKKLSQGARTILASAINMSMDGVPGMDSPAANERNLGKFSEGDYDKAIKYLRKSFSKGLLPKGQQYAKEVIKMMEESVELDEAKAEFQFSDKATAQKFMREVSQARQGSSTGTSDGKVTTDFTDLGNLELKSVAKIMKKYGGKLIKTSERQMAKVFEEHTELEEERGSKIQVMVKGDRNAYERLTRAIIMGKVPGYEGAMFKGNMTTLTFDAKKHTGAVRRKLAKMIKDSGGEFDRSIEEQLHEKEFKAHKMYHPTTGEEVDAKTREDHLKFKAMGYLHDKPDMEEGFASDAQRRAAFASGYKAKGKKK
jgi:hypothetical protein